MKEKEILKKLKKMLEDTKKEASSTKGRKGPVKSRGAHPSVGSWKEYDEQKGYSSVFMFSFIVLIFQLLFILVAYLIYK